MRVRRIATFVAFAVMAIPVAGRGQLALDAPHDNSFNDAACSSCHALFTRTASGKADYNTGCLDCHGAAMQTTSFASPWLSSDQAVPGASGRSHSWTGHAENPRYGATMPQTIAVTKYLLDGRMQCITCHNIHAAKEKADPASYRTSIAKGLVNAVGRTGSTAPVPGTATLALMEAGTTPKGYRIKILTVTGSGGTFAISHNFGLAAPTYSAPYGYTNGATVTLDDPTVKIAISANAAAGDWWDFYISHPMMRLTNIDDSACTVCHKTRVMDHVRARGEDPNYLPNGVRTFSHPVGVGLNAPGSSANDRTAVRDADGASAQNADSNDMVLDGGLVRCTTCHAVHNADSNSLTTDAR